MSKNSEAANKWLLQSNNAYILTAFLVWPQVHIALKNQRFTQTVYDGTCIDVSTAWHWVKICKEGKKGTFKKFGKQGMANLKMHPTSSPREYVNELIKDNWRISQQDIYNM